MDTTVQTICLISCCLIHVLASGFQDFDFQQWRPNDDLPKGCFAQSRRVLCFRIPDHLLENHSDAQKACQAENGHLASTFTQQIWTKIVDDLLKLKRGDFVWLGPKTPANSNKLIDIRNQSADLTRDPFWANYKPKITSLERCCYAYRSSGIIDPTGRCINASPSLYLCEYEYVLPENVCKMDTLRNQLPNASFSIIGPHSCLELTESVNDNITLYIKCIDGYVLDGPSLTTCHLGHWTEMPTCVKGCHLPESRKRSKLWSSTGFNKTYYEHGEKALFTCHRGYFSANDERAKHFTIKCREDGKWSRPDDDCILSHSQIEVTSVQIREKYQPITLKCPVFDPKLNNLEIIWFKNDEELSENEFHVIKENGSLLIRKATNHDVGYYYCLQNIRDKILSPITSTILYHLVFYAHCTSTSSQFPSVPSIDKVYSEGEFIVLRCHNRDYEQYSFKWFKNDEMVRGNEFHAILPTGSLSFEKLRSIDSGIYRCEAVNRATYCKYNVTHKITIIPKFENPCKSNIPIESKNISFQIQTQPWLVKIWQNDELLPSCYATIIDEEWIITTASCLDRFRRKKSFSSLNVEIGPNRHSVQFLKFHPNYRRGHSEYDVALLKLLSQIDLSETILPACLAENQNDAIRVTDPCLNKSLSTVSGTVGGWGSLDVDDLEGLIFKTENLVIVDEKRCQEIRSNNFGIGMFCSESSDEEPNFAGDSGSPFVASSKGKIYLIGIHTWGQRETKKGNFDYFTNVTFHYDWIQSIILSE